MPIADAPLRRLSPYACVLLGGGIGGLLDLISICTLYATKGVGPVRILHSIASGWLGGEAAAAGGGTTAAIGLVTHFVIACVMAYVYFLAARRWRRLASHPYVYGPLYGLLLYAVMTYVVVPLSAAGAGAWPPPWQWINLAHIGSHMLLVAIPCALGARAALRMHA